MRKRPPCKGIAHRTLRGRVSPFVYQLEYKLHLQFWSINRRTHTMLRFKKVKPQ